MEWGKGGGGQRESFFERESRFRNARGRAAPRKERHATIKITIYVWLYRRERVRANDSVHRPTVPLLPRPLPPLRGVFPMP